MFICCIGKGKVKTVAQDANIGDQVKRKTSGSLLFTRFIDDRHFERRFRASERLLTTAERRKKLGNEGM